MSTGLSGITQVVLGTGGSNSTAGFTTGTSAVSDFGCAMPRAAVAVTSTAALTSTSTLVIEGSLDNTNWFIVAADAGTVTATYTAACTKAIANLTALKPFRYLRVSLGTVAGDILTVTGSITGGSVTLVRAAAS